MSRWKNARNIVITLIASLGIAGLIGMGAYASFTSTATEDQTVSSGTMTLTIPADGASNRLYVTASDIAPGDTIQRVVDLTVGGTVDHAAITLTTAATASSLLDTDGTNGLQMVIDKCSQAWTEAGPPYTYTCGGSTSSVLASRAWIGSGLALSNMSLSGGSTNRLRVTLTFPSGAGNTFQGLTSTVGYTFSGTQRAGTDK